MIKKLYSALDQLKDLPLLALRLILAYGFLDPALKKLNNIDSIITWFDSMGMPLPALNAYLATITETVGVILLTLGLYTRLISIPLIIMMIVAIVTVHGGNGFSAGDDGFEIPLYYMLMLFTLTVYGSGKWSLDHALEKRKR